MFIGHFAAGIAARSLQPRLSMGYLFLSVQFLDLLWPSFLMLDIEKVAISPGITQVAQLEFTSYPISHSFIMSIFWSLLFGIVYYFSTRDKWSALILGLGVLSHWLLDVVVHVPDLPVSPLHDLKVGLGLWRSLFATVALEGAMFFVAILLFYCAEQRQGQIIGWGRAVFFFTLFAVYLFNTFGAVPASVKDVAVGAQFQWLIVVWAFWLDAQNRKTVTD